MRCVPRLPSAQETIRRPAARRAAAVGVSGAVRAGRASDLQTAGKSLLPTTAEMADCYPIYAYNMPIQLLSRLVLHYTQL